MQQGSREAGRLTIAAPAALLITPGGARSDSGRSRLARAAISVVGALWVAALALTLAGEATARDRGLACRPLSRSKVWGDCCRQSYLRNPSRVMSRRVRLRQIERCVRTRSRR
jgi:hypothetical protein